MTKLQTVEELMFFSVLMHYAERDSPDEEMRSYYKDVPGAMWITLLNLSGESPLANYSFWGKIVTGIVGVVATAQAQCVESKQRRLGRSIELEGGGHGVPPRLPAAFARGGPG